MKAARPILLLLLLPALLPGCRQAPPGTTAPPFPYGEMREGDLAFRCGRGVFSRAVLSAEQDPRYSHVGVLVKDDGVWKIVHAVPGETEFSGDFDRVKAEAPEGFFAADRAFRGCLVHTGLLDPDRTAALREEALSLARDSVRFDGAYNLADSSALYCTELVWMLYRHRGIDLSEGRRRYLNVVGIHADCLLPEHLYGYTENQVYYQY